YLYMIPREIVDDLVQRADIVALIGERVPLKQRGRHHVGRCPFHQDQTPSFTVTREKGLFYCFGCGTGGNVLKFLMLFENLSFTEAVERLAQRLGVVLPPREARRGAASSPQRERHLLMLGLARDFYRACLEDPATGAAAREYLARRGVGAEMRALFQLGYAPAGPDGLLGFLRDRGFGPEEMEALGLVSRTARGDGYQDYFRERLVFPIWDHRGNVLGFGARLLGAGEGPKYLNSRESEVFRKGNTLYAVHLAVEDIRRTGHAVVVEGYMDALAAHQYGARNVVASMGTSLTREQGRLLSRYTREVVIAYDGDAAGTAGVLRGLDLLQELGLEVRVMALPPGEDPDGLLRTRGWEGWQELARGAKSLVEFKLGVAMADGRPRTVAGKLAVLRRVLPSVARAGSEVAKEEYVKLLARELDLSWETVAGELRRLGQNDWLFPDKDAKIDYNMITEYDGRVRAEAGLLRLLLDHPEYLDGVRESLGTEFFVHPLHRRIFDEMLACRGRPGRLAHLVLEGLSEPSEQSAFLRLLVSDVPGDPGALLLDYTRTIRRALEREAHLALLDRLRRAEEQGDRQAVQSTLSDLQRLLLTKGGV
ncbi:MAG: DNA primase, partial [Firmicutes bacterium]|nr:DNA primase [Bacillota bacterium]